MVQKINAEARAIGDVVAVTRSTAVFHHGGTDATIAMPDESPIVPTGGTLTVGVFEGDNGRRLALVTNRDHQHETRTVRGRAAGGRDGRGLRPRRKSGGPATSAEPGAVPLTLPAGGGVLLRW